MPPPPPERVVDLAACADPVAAFRSACRDGALIRVRTGGTTSEPRALLRTTGSWVSSFPVVSELTGTGPASRVWVPGPVTATMNLFARVHADHAGATLVPAPEHATHAVLTPAALGRDLPRLARGTTVVTAGDRLPAALRSRAETAGLHVHHYYGAAELSFVGWGADEDHLTVFPGVEVEARNGELWVRSPFVFVAYDGPAGPLRRARDGFVTVGDRGGVEGGRLTVRGRPGSATTGGATVDLAAVEAVLRAGATGEVIVVASPHPDLGEVLVAVLTDARDLAAARDRATAGLAPAARPRRWRHEPALPLTPAGKVDRAALRARAADDHPDSLRPPR